MSQVSYVFLSVLQVLGAFAVIGLVLIQQGKGANAGAALGGGVSESFFGSAGSANFLTRTTAVFAVVFFVSTLLLVLLGGRAHSEKAGEVPSVMSPVSGDKQEGSSLVGGDPTKKPAVSTEPDIPVSNSLALPKAPLAPVQAAGAAVLNKKAVPLLSHKPVSESERSPKTVGGQKKMPSSQEPAAKSRKKALQETPP